MNNREVYRFTSASAYISISLFSSHLFGTSIHKNCWKMKFLQKIRKKNHFILDKLY